MVKKTKGSRETDGEFLLKLVMYLLIASLWIKLVDMSTLTQIPIPVGLMIALAFASRDRFQIDRKIEYAVILVGVLVGFWSNTGLMITL